MFDVGHLLNNVLSTMSYERRAKEREMKEMHLWCAKLRENGLQENISKSNREVLLRDMACRNHIQS